MIIKLMNKNIKDTEENSDQKLSIISHDIRSPLIAMIGFSQILSREIAKNAHTPRWLEMLDRIQKIGQDVLDMSEEIISMQKLENGKEQCEFLWIDDLPSELKKIEKTFQIQANAKDIELTLHIPASLPKVRWDINKLRYHVLNNLVANAIKFTPSGGKVLVTAEEFSETVLIRIQDTGLGVLESEKEKIFLPFEQGSRKSHRVFCGAGIGLYSAQLFFNYHNGSLRLDDSVECGATFLVELPIDALQNQIPLVKAAA